MKQKKLKFGLILVLKYIALALAAFIVLMPVLWFFTSSFRSNNEVFANINPFSLEKM